MPAGANVCQNDPIEPGYVSALDGPQGNCPTSTATPVPTGRMVAGGGTETA